MGTSMFFKLFSAAFFIVIHRFFWGRRCCLPSAIRRWPFKYWPVSEPLTRAVGPKYITSPPFSPARGPRSSRKSLSRMISGSCSTTTTVLDRLRSPFKMRISRWLSRGCNPILGSSRTYRVLTREDPRAEARATRWTSPPDKVRDWRSRVKYPRPTSFK